MVASLVKIFCSAFFEFHCFLDLIALAVEGSVWVLSFVAFFQFLDAKLGHVMVSWFHRFGLWVFGGVSVDNQYWIWPLLYGGH